MAEDRHKTGESPLPDDVEPVAGRTFEGPRPASTQADHATPPAVRAQHTPAKIRRLLERLEINRHGEWVWITTDGPISPEHARYRIDDGGERRDLPLLEADIEKWDGYSFDLIGLKIDWPSMQAKVESGLWGDGPVVHWGADLTLVVRYMRAQWHRKIEMTNTDSYSYRSSVLFAEYVVSNRGNPRERDGAIRGVALHHDTDDRKHAWLARDLLLKGLRGAPRGPRVGGDVERWVLRARQIGRPQARLEFKAGLGAMYTAADGRWWNVAVDPHIQQKRR